jgi:hypothetical protein
MTLATITIAAGQCNSLFSFTANLNKVTFINQSSISNAHYFWNFGDGTGSNIVNPIHAFPGNGNYLVTLFAEDMVSKCSSYYEYRVDVISDSNGGCPLSISDSIYTSLGSTYLTIYNTALICLKDVLAGLYSGGDFQNVHKPIKLSTWQNIPFEMVCKGQFYDRWGDIVGDAYKTVPYQYSSSHNYGDCSANFEFTVISKDTSGERILFTAMNKTAKSYEWFIYGFGNPINSSGDTISQFYPFPGNLYVVGLSIQGSSGCHDTIYQNIVVSNSVSTVLDVNNLVINREALKVFPNPSNGLFTIQSLGDVSTSLNIHSTVEIYNVLGEKVYKATLKQVQGENTINLSNQPNGVYLYRVIKEAGELVGEGKVVVQH